MTKPFWHNRYVTVIGLRLLIITVACQSFRMPTSTHVSHFQKKMKYHRYDLQTAFTSFETRKSFAMIPGFGRVATPQKVHEDDKIETIYKTRRWRNNIAKKPSKSSVEKPLLRPVSLEENRDHVSKCFDPTRCWRCLYLRNREEWGQVATLKSGGHIIGSWLCLTQHEDEDGSDFVGLSCIVCQKANVENNFSKGMVQFLDPLMG